jgi:hypothetical protein
VDGQTGCVEKEYLGLSVYNDDDVLLYDPFIVQIPAENWPPQRPSVWCDYDDFFDSLFLYFIDDVGQWDSTVTVDKWRGPDVDEISNYADAVKVKFTGAPGLTNGDYRRDPNDCQIITSTNDDNPTGWGLEGYLECHISNGTTSYRIEIQFGCSDFIIPSSFPN